MRRLIYLSEAAGFASTQELLKMCAEFASSNAREDVTGLLLRAGMFYFQILEGDKDVIEPLVERIATDPRHSAFQILSEKDAEQRLFKGWAMRLLDCGMPIASAPVARAALQKRLMAVEADFGDGKAKAEEILRSFQLAVDQP